MAMLIKPQDSNQGTHTGVEDVSPMRARSSLGLWWLWTLVTATVGALCWWVASRFLDVFLVGTCIVTGPLIVGAFILGAVQEEILGRYLPLSGLPGNTLTWTRATGVGFLLLAMAPMALSTMASGNADPMWVTLAIMFTGAVLGTAVGLLQMGALERYWTDGRPRRWLWVTVLALTLAALAWWLVFATLRAGGPPVVNGGFGPGLKSEDLQSTLAGGLAASLVYATVTATGLVWLYTLNTRTARTRRELAVAGGLTGLVLLAVFAFSVPTAIKATSIVTTVINPYYSGPTRTPETSMLGLKTQRVTSAPCGTWYWELAPSGVNAQVSLGAVDAVSADEAWAVIGTSALHWQSNRWNVMGVPLDKVITQGSRTGIEALSSSDVWLSGSGGRQEVGDTWPLFAHWDGKAWTGVAGPHINGEYAFAIAAIASDDIWSVGTGDDILHWDGKAWSAVPKPVSGQVDLNGVTAISSNDVWAVGVRYDSTPGVTFGKPSALTIHWDGRSWSKVPSPASKIPRDSLYAVSALSSDNVWAVGTYYDPGDRAYQQVPGVIHWDGKEWARIPTEELGTGLIGDGSGLNTVTASAPNDVWAAGQSNFKPLLLHWDGLAWSVVPSPIGNGRWDSISASDGTLWAMGTSGEVPGYENMPVLGRFVTEQCAGTNP